MKNRDDMQWEQQLEKGLEQDMSVLHLDRGERAQILLQVEDGKKSEMQGQFEPVAGYRADRHHAGRGRRQWGMCLENWEILLAAECVQCAS